MRRKIGYDRRTVLKTLGAGIAVGGASFASTPAAARDSGEPPAGNVPTTEVTILIPKDDPRPVEPGSWLKHYHGWIDGEGGDRTKADVERWLDSVETTPKIDGEVIENPSQYWGDVTYSEEYDSWVVFWEYYTPPKKPGLHEFSVEYSHPDGFEDTSPEEGTRDIDLEPGFTNTISGYYQIG